MHKTHSEDSQEPDHVDDLHESALRGCPDGVKNALENGADVNSLDDQGRTALACIVQGIERLPVDASDTSFSPRLEALRILLCHPSISLYTLNATDPQGATPLGAAAGMNVKSFVHSFLCNSAGTVSVDGMDSYGATALIHASHAGNLDIVRALLKHGARPDFRDSAGKSAIQRALSHPEVLWSCEMALRRHRWRRHSVPTRPSTIWDDVLKQVAASLPETHDPPPPVFDTFPDECLHKISANISEHVTKGDVYTLQTILFLPPTLSGTSEPTVTPPLLVNHPDASGWSPIHHCTSAKQPSIDVLMTLYLAGADLCLSTTNENFTPLHCLARSDRHPTPESLPSLLGFVVHLIRDLGAPMSAQDNLGETCMHIAAEHGSCLDILAFFLELDSSGTVREMRNSRGLTPLEVAKPNFRVAFGLDVEQLRSVSALSMLTIKPSTTQESPFDDISEQDSFFNRLSLISPDTDLPALCRSFSKELTHISVVCDQDSNAVDFATCSNRLREASNVLDIVFAQRRTSISLARQELEELQSFYSNIDTLLNTVTCSIDSELCRRGLRPLHFLKKERESEDSEVTAVSTTTPTSRSRSTSAPVQYTGKLTSSSPPSSWQNDRPYLRERSKSASSKYSLVQSEGSKKKSATSRFTNWLKRTVVPAKYLDDLDATGGDGHDGQAPPSSGVADCDCDSTITLGDFYEDEPIEYALQISFAILDAARRDLQSLEERLDTTRNLLNESEKSIRKAERLAKHAIQKRSTKIKALQLRRMDDELNEFYDIFTLPPKDISPPSSRSLTFSPSITSIASTSSCARSQPSCSSDHNPEDEDARTIRRLLTRRVGAKVDKALDEIQFEGQWLRIVQEALRDIKRRTYV